MSGFRSELIANLSKFREFTVVELTEERASRQPDVDYVLKADCADDQDDVKMIVTSPNRHPPDRLERHVPAVAGELAGAQQQLVGKIASTLEVYLSHDRLARIRKCRTTSAPTTPGCAARIS